MKNEDFDNKQINRLLRHVQTFARNKFGEKPSNVELDAIAMAVNGVFPKIKKEIIRNTNDGGKLGIGLRNKRFQINKNKADKPVGDTPKANLRATPETNNAEDVNEFELLKSTLVNNENMALIKVKLKLTLPYRLSLLRQIEINLLESFPYFFVSAELVRANLIFVL